MNDCQHDNHFFVVGAPENRQRGQQQKKEGRKEGLSGNRYRWTIYALGVICCIYVDVMLFR